MQLIAGGPHIPKEVLQAHDDGKLIFFCGAGISLNLGLPDFDGLLDKVREKLALDQTIPTGIIPSNEIEKVKGKNTYLHPDHFLSYLAKHLDDEDKKGFGEVKKAIIEILTIKTSAKEKPDYTTHEALLNLANYNGSFHLVTTNVDHGFSKAAKLLRLKNFSINAYPLLPPAQVEYLHHPVHLHGILDKENDPKGNNLIFTSADFGRAYLTDARAAKFVTELFSGKFTILLIGYSLNDPVLRYLTDALAYDGVLKEKVFAFADYDNKEEFNIKKAQWEFKSVTPILYNSEKNHAYLHNTLKKWDEIKNQLGKKGVISKYATKEPSSFGQSKISQVLWALNDGIGETAKFFANRDPIPPISWLNHIGEDKTNLFAGNAKTVAECVYITRNANFHSKLTSVQRGLLNWLAKHFDKEELFAWLINFGTNIHPELKNKLQKYLDNKKNELSNLDKAWQLLLTIEPLSMELFFPSESSNTSQLLQCVKPYVKISPLNRFEKEIYKDSQGPEKYATYSIQLGKWRLSSIKALEHFQKNKKSLTKTAFELTNFLKHAYDLQSLYDNYLYSTNIRASIAEHEKNKAYQEDLGKLVDLVRDSWHALLKTNPKLARTLVDYWQSLPYVIFRRLAFYAMSQSDLYTAQEILDYLLEDNGKWLWHFEVKCERYELIEKRSCDFSKKQLDQLIKIAWETYISSKDKFGPDPEYALYWLLFDLKENASNYNPSKRTTEFLDKHKNFQREEWQKRFRFHVSSGLASEVKSDYTAEQFYAMEPSELYEKLTDNKDLALTEARQREYSSGLKTKSESACNLANYMFQENFISGDANQQLWNLIFKSLCEIASSWQTLSNILRKALPEFFQDNIYPIFFWFYNITSKIDLDQEDAFLQVFTKFMGMEKNILIPIPDNRQSNHQLNDIIQTAINTPIGYLTEAIIRFFSKKQLKVKELLPKQFKNALNQLLKLNAQPPYYVQAILGRQLGYLFFVDSEWTKEKIINNMDFKDQDLSCAIWQGYLYGRHIFPDLLVVIKDALNKLISKNKFREVFTNKKFHDWFVELYVYSSLDYPKLFPHKEVQPVLDKFSKKELVTVARTIYIYIARSKNPDQDWQKKVSDWIKSNCPQKHNLQTDESTICFSQIILSLDSEMDKAYEQLSPLLIEITKDAGIACLANLASQPSQETPKNFLSDEEKAIPSITGKQKMLLEILHKIIDKKNLVQSLEWGLIWVLDELEKKNPKISEDTNFKELKKLTD